MRKLLGLCTMAVLGVSLVLSGCSASQAQSTSNYPNKPIDIIVAFSPGSGADTNARLFAKSFAKTMGVSVNVVNVPEGGGTIGWTQLSKAKPDGYTIGISTFPLLQSSTVLSKLEYDPVGGFTFLGNVALAPGVLAVKPDGPYKTLADLIGAAKAKPEKISAGVTGKGSMDYMIANGVQKGAGVQLAIVNFAGTAEALTAVLGGNCDSLGLSATSAVQYVKSGQVRALGVGGDKPFDMLPGVPTFKSAGIDIGIQGMYTQFIAPKGLPADVNDKLVKMVKAAVDDPDIQKQAADIALPLLYQTPEEQAALAKQMLDTSKEILK